MEYTIYADCVHIDQNSSREQALIGVLDLLALVSCYNAKRFYQHKCIMYKQREVQKNDLQRGQVKETVWIMCRSINK